MCVLDEPANVVDYHNPDIVNHTDYYAFGAHKPGSKWTNLSQAYKYTFNGKEKDPETVGTSGGTQDYGMRIYNPSLGRFLSVDPLTKSYPSLTPYQYASNSPIANVDLDGLEASFYMIRWNKKASTFELVTHKTVDSKFQTILGNTINNNKVDISFVYGTDGHWHQIPKEWESRSFSEAGGANEVFEMVNSWKNSDLAYEVATTLEDLARLGNTAEAAVMLADGIKNLKALVDDAKGIIYKRKDITGNKKDYVGQAKSEERFLERQKEHARNNPDSDFEFDIIDRGKPGRDLDLKEQKHIDAGGGPTNKSNPNGGLSNKKNVIKKTTSVPSF